MKRRDFLIGSLAAASVAAYSNAQDTVLMSKLDRVGAMSETGASPPHRENST